MEQCALCAARKAQGLHGISTELIEAHCAAEMTNNGLLSHSYDCVGCDCCGEGCSRSNVREAIP